MAIRLATVEEPPSTLALAATFAAAPLVDVARFWIHESGGAWHVVTAPPDQVLDHVREPEGLLRENRRGVNALFVRFSDLLAQGENVPAWIDQLGAALGARGADTGGQPTFIFRCPEHPDNEQAPWLEWEQRLQASVADLTHVQLVAARDLMRDHVLRPFAGRDVTAPYTALCLAGLGTALARRVYAAHAPRRRVLALACDGVLWNGLCGEATPETLVVDEPRRALQEFVLDRAKEGWLVCLVGRNDVADVRRTFAGRPDMPLTLDHVAALRVSWVSASDNLAALADELGVPASSIVSLHGCGLECAEVRANCPEILSLELPDVAERIPHFLRHVWAFDRSIRGDGSASNEPARRRRRPSGTTPDRAESLVEIRSARDYEFSRLSELTRTARHFNATGGHVTVSELEWFARQPGRDVLSVWLPTRRGTDAPAGVLRLRRLRDSLRVEDWWIGSAALGRGTEAEIMQALGRRAVAAGCSSVEVVHVPNRRNEPVRLFLESLGAERSRNEYAVSLSSALGAVLERSAPLPRGSGASGEAELIQRAAGALSNAGGVLKAIRRSLKGARHRSVPPYRLPRTDTERWLSSAWREVLDVDRVGSHDDFFELGGDSLAGARVMARVRSMFGVELSLADFFEEPTLEAQAGRLVSARLAHADPNVVRLLIARESARAAA